MRINTPAAVPRYTPSHAEAAEKPSRHTANYTILGALTSISQKVDVEPSFEYIYHRNVATAVRGRFKSSICAESGHASDCLMHVVACARSFLSSSRHAPLPSSNIDG